MERDGLVERRAVENDRRVKAVSKAEALQ